MCYVTCFKFKLVLYALVSVHALSIRQYTLLDLEHIPRKTNSKRIQVIHNSAIRSIRKLKLDTSFNILHHEANNKSLTINSKPFTHVKVEDIKCKQSHMNNFLENLCITMQSVVNETLLKPFNETDMENENNVDVGVYIKNVMPFFSFRNKRKQQNSDKKEPEPDSDDEDEDLVDSSDQEDVV
ncbi:hypothetical protein BpHYR1_029049 [Brachionus plicatilis]|uniref:Uncharacterized protein n=1 Tax=Brachionus plicatilis TaxID=10195 RepID=A0A3M7QIZ5_BRAPC|nr:hypothetical protein BpHYR1_029049 [Brachionus plicatilis]